MDLLTHRYWHLGFSGFTRNDQRASADLLGLAQPGDLVLRDLGYFVLGILQKFHQQGIWFLSRLRLDLRILDPNTGQDFKLLRRLRRFGSLDASVLLGHDNPLPVRLVALPLPPSVAAERRRRAKANRDRRLNPSKERLALLGWQIFVTNTSATQLKTQDIAHLYGQRWRIETIFKAWKSHFSLGHIRHDASLPQVQALVFARLIFILLVQAIYYPHLQQMAWKLSGSFLSFLKLADLMSTLSAALFTNLLARADPTLLQEALCKHAAYDKRNRPNLLQKLSCLG